MQHVRIASCCPLRRVKNAVISRLQGRLGMLLGIFFGGRKGLQDRAEVGLRAALDVVCVDV